MTSKQNVDLVQKALAALLESEGENKWITINGTHVQVDGKGSIVSGPANLKSWDAKPKWDTGDQKKESPKGTAKDWNAKPSWGGPSAPPPIAQANDQKAEAKAEAPIAQAKDQIKAPAQDAGKIGGKGRELEAPRISYMNPHDIAAQKDVKQFKEGANALTGEVEPLEGHYDHRGSGPIQVWQRNDGTHEVISGRHRLAHAKRNGVTELPVQVYKESEGFTQAHALGMDAELNIRDGNGSVADYARHFANNPHITEEDAKKKGLLGRAKGQSGWTIGRHGTEQLRAAHQGKKIKDSHAETIARIAPGDADIQRAGMTMAAEGKTGEHIENTLMSMKAQAFASGMSQADMFGNNDSAIKEMEETATRAGQIRRAINNQIHAVKGAANRPEEAKALGVDVSNPEEIKAKVKDLEAQAERWKNWAIHPDLAAQVFGRDMTPQAQAIAQAQAEAPKAQAEGPQAPPPVEPGVDMFGNPTGKAKPEMMTDLFGNQVTVDAEKQPEAPKAEDPSAWMDKPADLKKDGTGEMFGGLFSPDRQIPSEPSEPPKISQGNDEIPKANPDYRPPAGFVAPSNQDELHQRMTRAMDAHEEHAGSVDKYLAAQTGKLKKNADGYHVAIDPVTGQESILSKDESTAKAMQSALFATRSRAAGDKRDSAKADNHNLHQFVNAHDGKPFGDGDQAEEKGGYPNPTQGALHGDYPDNPEADKQPGATAAKGGEKPKRFWEPKGEIPEFHAHTGYKFKKMKGLTPEEEKEEAALHQYAQDNYEDLRDKYLQKGKETGKDGKTKYDLAHYDDEGNLASVNLNIDEWRDFLPGYKGTNPHVNQTTGHYLSSRLTHEMLHEMKGKGNNSIAVLAGGGGSGKTSAVKNYYNLKDYPIVLDQVTGDLDKANQAFDMAEKNGYGSKYIFVDRHPNDAWKEGVIKRAQSLHGKWTEWDQGGRQGPEPAKGRTVPVDVAVHDNFGARQTAHDLVKAGRQIDVVDNNHGFGKAKKLEDPQEQLKHFENPVNNHNFDETIKRAVNDTRELHQSGGLSDDHHGALLGRHASGNGHVQPAQLPTNAGSGLPNDPRGPEAASGTGGQGTPLGGSPSPTEAAEAGPSAPPTVSGTSPATPGRKRAALTKADQGTIQAEVDRLGHEMSQLKKSDPQYRILYKRRQHTLAKLSPTGSGGAGANSSATTPTPSGPAPAGPSAPPAMPAQAKPQRKAPEAIDGSQYFGPDGKLDTKTLGDHITKAGGTWDTDSAIARAYRPMRAALKAAPDVKTTYDVLDHIMRTQPALYNHAKQDAKYGNLPHHILIGNHYQLRNGVPLKRTNGQTVGSLPSKAYQDMPGEVKAQAPAPKPVVTRPEAAPHVDEDDRDTLNALSRQINNESVFNRKRIVVDSFMDVPLVNGKNKVLDHLRYHHPDVYERLRDDPGRLSPKFQGALMAHLKANPPKAKGTQESFRPKPQQTITRLVDWLTQE